MRKAGRLDWRQADPVLLVAALGLLAYGLVLIYSATFEWEVGGRPWLSVWVVRQAVFAALGLLVMVAVAATDYRVLRALSYHVYGLSVALLAGVLLFGRGDEEFGARRWFDLGFFLFQPSELAKLALVLTLARFFETGGGGELRLTRMMGSALFVLPLLWLVYLQPDLGSSGSFVAIWLGMVVAAGARPQSLAITAAGGLVLLPVAWLAMKDYMRSRLLTYLMGLLGEDVDPFGEGYNILQARISIGSGGMFGKGLTQGTQTQLDYLRVQHSDFIFAVLAEELGFVGGMALFLLYGVLLFRIVRVASGARDSYGRLVAYGIASTIFYHFFVNVGANLTLLPFTGIPLPLVSYGGSAMISILAMLGLVESIALRRGRLRF